MTPPHLCLFGFGYVAAATRAALPGSAIQATTRSADKAAAMRSAGIDAHVVDFLTTDGSSITPRPEAAWLISVPPTDTGCPVYARLHEASGISAARPAWIGYLSSTGVYGDLGGGWAFEETPPCPSSLPATRRVIAEKQWRSASAHIIRLPGIYGPGRSALESVLRPGTRRIIKPGQVFSRIHVEDIASALIASMRRPNRGRTYNITDDRPAPSDAVLSCAAELLGVPPPPRIPHDRADQPHTRFYAQNRRVSNARAKAELGWRPRYPDYRAGLSAIHAAHGNNGTGQ